MRFKLVVLFALLMHWKLSHIQPEWRAHAEAAALCHWNRDLDSISEALGAGSKTCTWLLAGPYGRQGELWTIAGKAIQWLEDSIRTLTTAS